MREAAVAADWKALGELNLLGVGLDLNWGFPHSAQYRTRNSGLGGREVWRLRRPKNLGQIPPKAETQNEKAKKSERVRLRVRSVRRSEPGGVLTASSRGFLKARIGLLERTMAHTSRTWRRRARRGLSNAAHSRKEANSKRWLWNEAYKNKGVLFTLTDTSSEHSHTQLHTQAGLCALLSHFYQR